MPVANRAVQNYALNFFISGKWQRVAISIGMRFGFGRMLSEGRGEEWGEITDILAQVQGELINENIKNTKPESVFYAMRQGSKGPYQKTSLIAINQTGQPLFYAKVAVGVAADSMVEAESTCLERLTKIVELNGIVPQRLSFGKTPSGRAFFTTTVASALTTTNQFLPQHEKFLSTLGHATVQWVQYANSAESQFAQSALERLKPVLGQDVYAQLNSAVHNILSEIGHIKLPMVLAHRDFAPWNIRLQSSGTFVFDWEYAADGANPVYDFFHYQLIQKALSLNGLGQGYKFVNDILKGAFEYLKKTFPDALLEPKIVEVFLLSYLVDLVLFYVNSANLLDKNHPVLSAYLALLNGRSRWLTRK